MNELSRMDRHQRRHKGRKKDNKAASEESAFRSKSIKEDQVVHERAQQDYDVSAVNRTHEVEELRRSRREDHSYDKFELDEESVTPTRTSTYPSSRVRMSKWFVNSLIVIFILLMAGLVYWGLIGAPPLEEMF
ncbi:hypothetical protein [Paenibacillus dakarensis]|uniref:hypothetical protein n=1 Tax=Paenibacillus dakarensis TaxID=1527293 RepID=UPI0006D54F6F|nr:hypothetical protein [Paenibacillus dakarensis]